MSTHLAAVSLSKGQPFEIQTRPTPIPGLGEVLIAVKSIALNPADGYMRDQGLFISTYPTVLGFDISGLVLQVGEKVPTGITDDNPGLSFRPGITRVAAYVAFFWKSCDPDYGAFQERCLVPWQHAAATLPVAVQVSLGVWDILGIPRVGEAAASASASSASFSSTSLGCLLSVGTMCVQSARLLREDPNSSFAAVYATAGWANKEYVGSLGANRVFDYKDPQVVDAIVSAAKEDGLVIRCCFLATGQLAPCQAILKAFLEDEEREKKKAKIGSAPRLPPSADVAEGVDTIWLQPSMEEGERLEKFQYWIWMWLRENLAKKAIKPSLEPKVVGRGLEAINSGSDLLLQGVSCAKLVVEVEL
ncbi:GroES-like protein [Xylariaceae sp. FL1651]|nr:GroES-like protein [Xylariaceae sp. FL1651]